MIRRPPRSTRTDTLFPYTTLFRSSNRSAGATRRGGHVLALQDLDIPAAQAFGKAALPVRAADHKQILYAHDQRRGASQRSEEHTSELQSLMRISYAVFCLKKKKNNLPPTLKNPI